MFTLGRKIDVSYKPNLLMVLAVVILTGIGWVVTDEMLSGITLGGGVFITWALSRELDPAHDYSAFIAAVLSLFILSDIESIQFLPIFWLLLLLRGVNGITGKELTLLDLILLLTFTGFVSFRNENGLYLLLFVLAMVFNRQTGTENKWVTLAGGLGLVLFLVQIIFLHPLVFNPVNHLSSLNVVVVIAAVLSPVVFWFLSQGEMEDDKGNDPNRSKIFASQLLYNISLLLFVFFSEISFANQIVYLSVVIGVSLYFIGTKIFLVNDFIKRTKKRTSE